MGHFSHNVKISLTFIDIETKADTQAIENSLYYLKKSTFLHMEIVSNTPVSFEHIYIHLKS